VSTPMTKTAKLLADCTAAGIGDLRPGSSGTYLTDEHGKRWCLQPNGWAYRCYSIVPHSIRVGALRERMGL